MDVYFDCHKGEMMDRLGMVYIPTIGNDHAYQIVYTLGTAVSAFYVQGSRNYPYCIIVYTDMVNQTM